VTRLLRVAYGGIELGALPPGAWRSIAKNEIETAFGAVCAAWIDRGRTPGSRGQAVNRE
jgi:hypothetical protein